MAAQAVQGPQDLLCQESDMHGGMISDVALMAIIALLVTVFAAVLCAVAAFASVPEGRRGQFFAVALVVAVAMGVFCDAVGIEVAESTHGYGSATLAVVVFGPLVVSTLCVVAVVRYFKRR